LECAMTPTKQLNVWMLLFLVHPYSARISENVGNIIISGGLLPRVQIDNDDIFQKLMIQSCAPREKQY